MKTIDTVEIKGDEYRLRDSASQAMIAGEFVRASGYAAGDYARREGRLYRCTSPVAAGDAWSSAKWTPVTLGEALAQLAARVAALENG